MDGSGRLWVDVMFLGPSFPQGGGFGFKEEFGSSLHLADRVGSNLRGPMQSGTRCWEMMDVLR